MSKKSIRNLAAISLGTLFLGVIVVVAGSGESVGVATGILILIVCGITGCLSYFGALVKIARMRRMGWFLGVLFFGVLAALIYGLVGPETQISNEAMGAFLGRSYKQTKKTMGF